jgi:glycosyltransferase involved in cell wall biosynthesis
MEMPLKNIEGHLQYDIPEDWYAYRSEGISAFIRTKGDERWIGPCIESILDFFDEIVVTIDKATSDRTAKILAGFESKKIQIYRYPFELDPSAPEDSVHSGAYYSNWTISKTNYSHVCQWDADMIMLPKLKECKDLILLMNVVRFAGMAQRCAILRSLAHFH